MTKENKTMKPKLQKVTLLKVMTVKECLDALNRTYDENEDIYEDVTCDWTGVKNDNNKS